MKLTTFAQAACLGLIVPNRFGYGDSSGGAVTDNQQVGRSKDARFRPVASHPLLPCVRVTEEPTGPAKARARECHIDGGHSFAGRGT
jgi:hypothetical protein